MAKIADQSSIQTRMLNSTKGPAVYSPRAQVDRRLYQEKMIAILENTQNLHLRQAEITHIMTDDEQKSVLGVLTRTGAIYLAKRVIITTGTYLDAMVFIGTKSYSSGPDNIAPANFLASDLQNIGFNMRRFKTGTPVRVNRRSIDFSQMEEQKSDDNNFCFSYANEEIDGLERPEEKSCYICYTNDETKKIIEENLHRSALFSGMIEGVGPRYCPSIEDKIVRFTDKERHQIFVEPMGVNSQEMYLMGLSSSLPEDVQMNIVRSIKGMENAVIQRSGYAIEYASIDPMDLGLDLQTKRIKGLYTAGQINGTSGYEEAAAQGLIAGINACLDLENKPPFILKRNEAYIGVLIDDLVNKGTLEPYRMMTSRAEYRLILRQDNADSRLRSYGYNLGLVSEEEMEASLKKFKAISEEIKRLENNYIYPNDAVAQKLYSMELPKLNSKLSYADLLARPQYSYKDLLELGLGSSDLSVNIKKAVEIQIKYKGYINLEEKRIERFLQMENKKLPAEIDYFAIHGLSMEARQKLSKYRPLNIGQASRISGVSPADISVLLVAIKASKKG